MKMYLLPNGRIHGIHRFLPNARFSGRIYLTLICCCFFSLCSMAQSVPVSGVVRDDNAQALAGATVRLKGTDKGVSTSNEGKYLIDVPNGKGILIVSFSGFGEQEINVNGQSVINVQLKKSDLSLDAVIVVGYGTQKRKDISGAIASVDVSKLAGTPLRSVDQALQGRVAGVTFTQNSGMPGAGSAIRIRGGNSITGSNEPLYVIDGVPVFANPGNDAFNLNPLNSINTNDIESIEVLKDASATSIYGSRGGNGVIIITTKKGDRGQTAVNFDAYYGIQNVSKKYELLNASQFEVFANEANVAAGGPPFYDITKAPEYETDWQELIYRKNAPIRNYQVSVSGGELKTRYLVTASYFDQQGVSENSGLKRYSLRANLDKEISKKVKFGSNLSATNVDADVLNANVLLNMLSLAPNLPVYKADGTYTSLTRDGLAFDNPVAQLERINRNRVYRFLGNMYGSIDIAKGLTFKTLWGIDGAFSRTDSYLPKSIFSGSQVGGSAFISTDQTITWLNENTLNYRVQKEAHNLDVLGGYTQQTSRYESLSANVQNFLNDNLGTSGLGTGSVILPPGSSVGKWSLSSFLARVNYGYDSRYLLTLTGRYDGSSRFGANNRWGFFPSAAFAWRIDQEHFMQDRDIFSNLKLRMSYGITGNQDGIGNTPSLDLLGTARYVTGNATRVGITATQIANPDLKWESTAQSNLGVDIGILNDRVTFTFDAYYKKTRDLLLSVIIPSTSGFTTALKNIGSIENKGLEFSVTARPVERNFNWETSVNLSINRNKILDLGGSQQLFSGRASAELRASSILRVGEPLGTFYGYTTAGVFQTAAEIPGSADPAAKPGDRKFIDLDGNKIINDLDRSIIGYAQPDFTGGFNNTFSYKAFNLGIFVQGSYGNKIYNANEFELETLQGLSNQSTSVLNRWTPANTNATVPRANNIKPVNRSLDVYVEDGSYLRVKNVQLSYNIPVNIMKKMAASSGRIYVNAQNFYTITNYSGLDPEVSRFGSDNSSPGFDSGAYPNAVTFTFGINIVF